MSLPFTSLGNVTGSLFSGSFLSEQDVSLFAVSQSMDLWFGFSPNDVIEFSTFDVIDDTLTHWSILDQEKHFKTVSLTFIDNLNIPHPYSYRELIREFVLFKNDKILINPIDDLNSIGITEGTFKTSYNFVRQMAGSPTLPLTIKEVSPSRTELKIIPSGVTDVSYTSFCLKKFPTRDVIPVLLSATQNLPYDRVFQLMVSKYSNEIAFLKTIFFLNDDGSVLTFLKNLYEDLIKYTILSESQITSGIEPDRISRIQGIRSYFNNFLLQNYESIFDFNDIEKQFSSIVNLRLDQRFVQFLKQKGDNYKGARQFCYDFFVKYFYQQSIHPIQQKYEDKYFSYFKNFLNFGNNKFIPILTHDFLDERKSPTDPLTLLIKLGSTLPADIDVKSNCWVSNFGMTPYIFTAILQNPIKFKTIKISSPNFGTPTQFITTENVNKLYSATDLKMDNSIENSITINKTTAILNTDFSNFSNFIVFSSAFSRINIFKNKITELSNLSSSLSILNTKYLNSLSSSIIYPYYLSEKNVIDNKTTEIINSFDGYESYLYNSNNYIYSVSSASFISSSFVIKNDNVAFEYDRSNRDSLINNTPDFIIKDSKNEEYLTFLAMIGHHFDNIYTYISALPIERQVRNELSSSIPINTLKEMLISFGWNVDDIIGGLDIDEVYLNSLNSPIFDSLSSQKRLQTIWNRILITLPAIYKAKGTEECVKFLMSCYGLPTSLISIREYGGTDFSNDPQPTYKLDEKTYMLKFSGVNDYIEGPIPSTTKTVELKFSIENAGSYTNWDRIPLFSVIPSPYSTISNVAWSIDIFKVPGQYSGKVAFTMKSGSTGAEITSSVLPIFNGDIFSVMIRKDTLDAQFESNTNLNSIPSTYDLIVQRNEDGRRIFYSTSSMNLGVTDNIVFSQFGRFRLSNGNFIGTLDKLSIWDVPIDDSDFEEHTNDINSYGFSGSNAYQNLWVRLFWDYPVSMYSNISGSSSIWVDNRSPYYAIPNYYSGNLSSSIDSTLYSASLNIIQNRWLVSYPTGSVQIIGYNFPSIIDPNWSASFNGCSWISSSVYPFSFRELTYQQDIDASKYGPNKYKNKKLRKVDYTIESRFDSDDRATNIADLTTSGESNQLGFFIDPQDSKNKDIIRYVGRNGIMEFIGDPGDIYSDRYEKLINKNYEYHAAGDKRTFFNELLTVYKFYFDKSIFQAIKNVVPARANIFTGVVIEPTILERPKYQNRPITSSVQASFQTPGIIQDIVDTSTNLLWANFNTDYTQFDPVASQKFKDSLPPSYQQTIDLTRINEPIRIRSTNLHMGYVTDFQDFVQFNTFGDYEGVVRGWEQNPGSNRSIDGSVSRQKPGDLPKIGPHHINSEFDLEAVNTGSHQILYYMLKIWDIKSYYVKTGEYSRTNNPNDDHYSSASVSLYKYVMVDESFMRRMTYFYENSSAGANDPTYNFFNGAYTHSVNTFRNTPDQIVSNVYVVPSTINPINPADFQIAVNNNLQYFELSIGYPRNHYTHKMEKFSKTRYPRFVNQLTSSLYTKGKQTIDTTIGLDGIDNGTFPVESFNVSNVNVVNTSNIIQSIASPGAGTVIPQ